MAKSRSRRSQKVTGGVATLVLTLLVLLCAHFFPELFDEPGQRTGTSAPSLQAEGELLVHFIDVGQADCELIQAPGKTVLIDAGERESAPEIAEYLHKQGVERIDLLMASHPHADHIGGMSDIVDEFEIGEVLFGEVPEEILPTTKTYERLLDSIDAKGLRVTVVAPETQYDLGGGAALTILGPLKGYGDLNNTSIVCRLDYGDTAFLFTGDAETENEDDLLNTYPAGQFKADVLKLGHHGSSTSSGAAFLKAVDPRIAIASCGKDNSYGHPHRETLKKMKELGITLYRTDEEGTVVIGSDGETLETLLPAA